MSTTSPRGSNAANHEFLNTVLFHYDYDDPELGTVKVPVTLGEYLASETEHLKAEIRTAFLELEKARSARVSLERAFEDNAIHGKVSVASHVAFHEVARSIDAQMRGLEQVILALTATAGGAE